MTINQRLKDFFDSKNILAPVFYKRIGVSRTVWSSWINDFKPITVKQIQSIVNAYEELNARWLLTGEGDMLIVSSENDTVNKIEDAGSCYRCQEKDRQIQKLQNDLIESQKETIAALKGEHNMCFTGLRISDLKSVTTDSLVGDMLVYFPKKTRNHKRCAVKVPLNSWSRQLIGDEKSLTNKLFNCLSEQKMNERIKEIVKVDKIKKEVSNHIARHTFATLWLSKTHDVAGLQKLLGHSDISMTMIYVHINDAMVKEQMRNFENTLFTENNSNLLTTYNKNPGSIS